MENMILPGTLTAFDGQFATVKIATTEEDESQFTEVMVLTSNISSQNMPHVDETVLVALDYAGDAYILGSFASDAQTRPETNVKDIVMDNDDIKIRLTDGKIEIRNAANELISILDELSDKLISTTVATMFGAQNLSISLSGELLAIKNKLLTFKVV